MSSEFETWDEPYLEDAPTYTLHSAKGVVWGTFIGSPLAAGVLLAINYWRLGKTTAAQITFALFAVGTAAFFALVYAMPDDLNIPNIVFTIPQLFMVYGVTNLLQADDIREHVRNGGKLASPWAAVGIGLLCLIPVLGGIFGYAYLEEQSFGTVVKFGNDEVYYAGDATEEEARKLASVLQDIDYFGSDGVSVRLESDAGHDTVSFILIENAWNEADTVEAFREVGRSVMEAGFSKPLTVQLCNEYFEVQKTLTIPE